MSHRPYYVLALALTVAPLSFTGCSASGDGGGSKTQSNTTSSSGGSPSLGGLTGGTPNLGSTAGTANLGDITGGGTSGSGSDSCGQVLPVVFRDFKGVGEPGGHPDFEASARGIKNSDGSVYKGWNDVGCGLVEPALGTDGKPHAYTGMPDIAMGGPMNLPSIIGKQQRKVGSPSTGCYPATSGDCGIGTCSPWAITPITYSIMSGASFDQWYNTTPSVNMEIPGELMLTETPAGSGISVYDTTAFFPIDNKGFGNTPGQTHNYHFTTEIHVKFKYAAGQKFTFRGDDDLWIFVNGKLALDVGGQHQALLGTIDFDAQAATLGIMPGGSYPMDIFHAERQTSESNFRIETNIKCFEPVVK